MPGGRFPPRHGPRVRSQSTAGRERGGIGHADGSDGEAGRRDAWWSRQRGNDAAEVRTRSDGFAVHRTGAGHAEQRADAGRGRLAGPGGTSVGRREDAGAADGGARRRAEAADGLQGRRSGGSSQVVPLRTAVSRADHVRSGRQAGRVAGARDAVERGRRRGRRLGDPGGPAVPCGEDHRTRSAGRQAHGGAVQSIRARDPGEIGDDSRV